MNSCLRILQTTNLRIVNTSIKSTAGNFIGTKACNCLYQFSTFSRIKTNSTDVFVRCFRNSYQARFEEQARRNKTTLYYLCAFTMLVGGCTYSSVLLYRLYCQTTGKGGQAFIDDAAEKVASMTPIKDRLITVNFNADLNSAMQWNFKPQQPFIKVTPGQTALAFYTATNPTDKPITGVATYNILPFEAGKYFNKIQCFCFEEQQLNPNEEVDMPVFFYLDPEFAKDPRLENIHDIILSYTFFEAKEGMQITMPSFS